ncbi:hypothetical protein GCM10023085_05360 [Actinomadura viridis]|uniref:DUF4192 domain-containing protein n=1 Tax=Actinomadura viridis TaxID=58110 RepID=A0A931GSY0_9ACTN|nr:DUF4192 domain-containing protein [Actinomadura viridis]MBG6091354.1 hypothetical protein [Actinomadura viridis]
MTATSGRTPLVIRSIPDAIAAVPYVLGFHPADSLVVIAYAGPHDTCAVRVDLPGDPYETGPAARRIAALLGGNGFRRALLLGYGPEHRVTPAAAAVLGRLPAEGLKVDDAARVADGRWWSLLCHDTACCPREGHPYDISASVVAAQATLAGQVALPDRSELVRSVAPLTGPARASMSRATDRAEDRFLSWARQGLSPARIRSRLCDEGLTLLTRLRGRRPPAPPPAEQPYPADEPRASEGTPAPGPPKAPGRDIRPDEPHTDPSLDSRPGVEPSATSARTRPRADPDKSREEEPQAGGQPRAGREPTGAVRRLPGTGPHGTTRPGDDEIAWLGVLLTSLRIRDEAWVRIDEERPHDDIAFWRDVLCRIDEAYASAPACLLAYAAYCAGDGGLANVALDRAAPDYSMGVLLRDIIEAGIPPARLRMNMTSDELAAAYAEVDDLAFPELPRRRREERPAS